MLFFHQCLDAVSDRDGIWLVKLTRCSISLKVFQAAAVVLKKLDDALASSGEDLGKGLAPLRLWESGVSAPKIFENTGANLCNVMHLGVKICFLNRKYITQCLIQILLRLI